MIDLVEDRLWLGSVTATSLAVIPIAMAAGQMAYITTYEFPLPRSEQTDIAFHSDSADDTCRHVIGGSVFSGFERPICATACIGGMTLGFETAVLDASV